VVPGDQRSGEGGKSGDSKTFQLLCSFKKKGHVHEENGEENEGRRKAEDAMRREVEGKLDILCEKGRGNFWSVRTKRGKNRKIPISRAF